MFSTYGKLHLIFSTIPMLQITELGFCLAFAAGQATSGKNHTSILSLEPTRIRELVVEEFANSEYRRMERSQNSFCVCDTQTQICDLCLCS